LLAQGGLILDDQDPHKCPSSDCLKRVSFM